MRSGRPDRLGYPWLWCAAPVSGNASIRWTAPGWAAAPSPGRPPSIWPSRTAREAAGRCGRERNDRHDRAQERREVVRRRAGHRGHRPCGGERANSSSSSVRRAAANPPCCASSPAWRMPAPAQSFIDGDEVSARAPSERGLSMVFQSYALYPHMNVRDNIGFGLKIGGMDRAEIDRRVRRAADTLRLGDYLDRRPKELSGGQRQRVAIGRAIVRQPGRSCSTSPCPTWTPGCASGCVSRSPGCTAIWA